MANHFYVGFAVTNEFERDFLGTSVFDHISEFSNVPWVNPNLQLWLRSDVNLTMSGSN